LLPRAEAPPGLPKFTKRVLNPIYDHVFSSLDNEVGGVLVGHYSKSGGAPVITGSIAALAADGARASVTFTHEAWSDIHEALDRRKDNAQIVGWYHSHPGFGIFLSEHDLFIHRNFFSGPSQIAFVVDPHAAREGTFGWVDGEIVQLDERDTGRPASRPRVTRVVPAAPGGALGEVTGDRLPASSRDKRANMVALAVGGVLIGASAGFILFPSSTKPEPNQATHAQQKPKQPGKTTASPPTKPTVGRQQGTTTSPGTGPAPTNAQPLHHIPSTPVPTPPPPSGGTPPSPRGSH
jgi:proteasome lid subunit RPN8/RPN11